MPDVQRSLSASYLTEVEQKTGKIFGDAHRCWIR